MKSMVLERLSTLTTTAFGLVAALAWNEAIRGLFKEGELLGFLVQYGPWIYALSVTVIAVIAAVWIGKMIEKAKEIEGVTAN